MSSKTAAVLVVICLLIAQSLLAAPPGDLIAGNTTGQKSIDNTTYINANSILMFVTNHGNIGRDLADVFGYDAGTFYPYTTIEAIEADYVEGYVLYGAGLWVGGMVNGEIRVAMAEYSDEYVPGPMSGGTYQQDNPSFKVYKLYSDSLAHNPNNDYLNWPVDQGAPTLENGSPRMFGDQTLWAVFNDADPDQHTNNSGETEPLGLEIRQTVWAAAEDNVFDTVLHAGSAQIVHAGDADFELTIEVDDITEILELEKYEVSFHNTGGDEFVWNIYDATSNTMKVENRPYPTEGGDEVSVDGLTFVLTPLENGIEKIEEIANGNGPLNPPDNVMYSLNSTGDWYISSDAGSDFSRMNWRGLMGEADWEIRFTYGGSEYYDWSTDLLQPDRAPFEVWNIGEGTPDDASDDVRINFSFIDDDQNGIWSWGDRLYPWEVPYTEPAPANAFLVYTWPDDFRIGRIVFNDYSEGLERPEEGTVVRFTSHKITPISEQDTVYVTAPQVYVDYVGEKSDELYIAYEIHNKGNNTIEDCYISLWADPDLGGAGDDLVGCDPENDIFYCYNGDGNDRDYGLTPPAIGFRVLRGPLAYAPGEVGDYFGNEVPDYTNLGLTAFSKYINGTDPDNAQETYNYMRGLNRDGDPYVYNGIQTTFVKAGDPVTGTGDIDTDPADRRMMGSFGPMTMNPGDSQFVLIKMAVGRSGDHLKSIIDLRDKLNRPFTYPEDVVEANVWNVSVDGSDESGDGSGGNPFATAQRAVDEAVSGDVVLIHPGNYSGEGNRDILVDGKELTVKGASAAESVVIDCGGSEAEPHLGIKFEDCSGTSRLENLTITGAFKDNQEYYSAVDSRNSNLLVQNCQITGNEATGVNSNTGSGILSIYDSDISGNSFNGVNSFNLALQIEDCRIADNGYAGIGSYGFQPRNTSVYNSIITGNGRSALDVQAPGNLWATGNTIADNWNGLVYFVELPKTIDAKLIPIVQIDNNIFAYNDHYGVTREFANTPISMSCNLFYNNAEGDLSGLEFDTENNDNIFMSPEFCSVEENNFYLRETSPCLAENNACGEVIGAYGISADECAPSDLINLVQWTRARGGNNHWYGVYPVPQYWIKADSIAGSFIHNGSDTGYLATVLSQGENDFILNEALKNLNPPTISDEFWLGGRYIGEDDAWGWITEEPFTYTNWAAGEPDNGEEETALGMYGPTNTDPQSPGTWNNSFADDASNPFRQYWAVVEFGKASLDILHPSNEWVDIYCETPVFNGESLQPGDIVRAFDGDMNLCGIDTIDAEGHLGFMPVYRDYSGSITDEGMDPGEMIRFTLNGIRVSTEPPVSWTEMGDRIEVCDLTDIWTDEIPLETGWNLISWNIANADDDLVTMLNGIMDNVELVMGFEGGGLTYDPDLPGFSTLHSLDHYHGYWFKMTAPDELIVAGYPIGEGDFIALENEWNLISYWPSEDFDVPTALSGIYEDVGLVLGWRDGHPQTYDPVLPEYSTLNYMSPRYGYWLRMNQPAYLYYGSDMPKAASKGFAVLPDYVTRVWNNIYSPKLTLDGEAVSSGTLVKAVGSDGKLLGTGTVEEDGKFGFMPVYGDDPITEGIEGIADGGEFYLMVGDTKTENRFIWSQNMVITEITSLKSADILPGEFALAQNYPNPFNPETRIKFSLPQGTQVSMAVYDILGRKVTTLVDEYYEAGNHDITWYGTDDAGRQVASGVYFYRIKAGDFEKSRKMLLVK